MVCVCVCVHPPPPCPRLGPRCPVPAAICRRGGGLQAPCAATAGARSRRRPAAAQRAQRASQGWGASGRSSRAADAVARHGGGRRPGPCLWPGLLGRPLLHGEGVLGTGAMCDREHDNGKAEGGHGGWQLCGAAPVPGSRVRQLPAVTAPQDAWLWSIVSVRAVCWRRCSPRVWLTGWDLWGTGTTAFECVLLCSLLGAQFDAEDDDLLRNIVNRRSGGMMTLEVGS